ncbi:MAG: hypothetical protein JWL80_89, partial [Parcubacteria group bacterium]|nr:hypothetical protein [Parcubacteria group bacterium]
NLLVIISFWLASFSLASAADLTISPLSGIQASKSPFSVTISVSNNTQAINAVSGTLNYPVDLLSVSSISKEGSIIKLWPNEPSFSNRDGVVNFEGIILNPGFSGSTGKVLTVTFVPKKTGKANLLFSGGSVLANDGEGTNVLGSLGAASFTLSSTPDVVNDDTTTVSENPLVPTAPKITSLTNPDPNKWYSNSTPVFTWNVPKGVTAVRLLYDKSPNSIPTKTYTPAIEVKKLDPVQDGTYYFHAQFKNEYGWGAVSHFRFRVDTEPPLPFKITFPHGSESDNPQPIVLFNTSDTGSGISHYEIKIGEGDLLTYTPEAISNPYAVPLQLPGKRSILVKAIDGAGNSAVQTADFVVTSIQPPVITSFRQEISQDDILKVRGTSYENATVVVYLKDKSGQVIDESTKTNSSGDWALVWTKRLDPGVYEVSARTIDGRGAKSQPVSAGTLTVREKVLFRVGKLAINYLTLGILLIMVVAALIAFAWFIFTHLVLLRKRLNRDISTAESSLHHSLMELKEDFKEELKLLEGAKNTRTLTKEEGVIIKNLNKRISAIEKNLAEDLRNIKRDVGK